MMAKLPNWGLATRFALVTLVALIGATFVNFAITFSGPPPVRRPVPLTDAVQLVSSGAQVSPDYNWVAGPLTRSTFQPGSGERALPLTAAGLAKELRVPPADVRLTASPGLRSGGLRDPTSELFNSFTLGLRQPDGTWRIVRAAPSPAITQWHWVTLGSALLAALIFALLALIVARSVIRPLERLGREASRAGLDRQNPITLDGPPEVARVGHAVAAMRNRLRNALDNRTALFTAVAHDMAAPVARLRFSLTQLPEAVRESAEADIEELSEMIAAIVEFSALDRRPPELGRVDAVAIARDLAERERIPFESNTDHMHVLADPILLRRLLSNLVVNARRYGGGGELIATATVNGIVLSVLDRGPGVPAELAERIFEPFFRVEPSRSRDTAGTGLGLAIARAIAESHNSVLTYSQRAGGGAAFELCLPAAPPEFAPKPV